MSITDLTDITDSLAIAERLLKHWFTELDSLQCCTEVRTLNYVIDDLARLTAVHKSLLHMAVLAAKLKDSPPDATLPPEGGTTNLTPAAATAANQSDSPSASPLTLHSDREPSIRETDSIREVAMLPDIPLDRIKPELDRITNQISEHCPQALSSHPSEPGSSPENTTVESAGSVGSQSAPTPTPTPDAPARRSPFICDQDRELDPRCVALGIHPAFDTINYPDNHPFFIDDRDEFRNRYPKLPKPKNRSR